jgi:hypothetical protein
MNIFLAVVWVIAAVLIHNILKIVVSLNYVVLRRVLVNIKQSLNLFQHSINYKSPIAYFE